MAEPYQPRRSSAETFCATPGALAYDRPFSAVQTFGKGTTAEMLFADQSTASTLDGVRWFPRSLDYMEVYPDVTTIPKSLLSLSERSNGSAT